MDTLQDTLLVVGLTIHLLLIIAGLRKSNIQLCYSFFVYHAAGFASSVAVTYVIQNAEVKRAFYVIKELGLDAVKIAILLELNTRLFRYYPRVKQTNSLLLKASALVLPLYVWLFPSEAPSWWGAEPLEVHSKINQVLGLVFMAFAGSVLFYRLPIHSRHKFLLLGFLFSQFPLALGYATAAAFGESHRERVSVLNAAFFVLALVIWSKVYWPPYVEAVDPDHSGTRGLGNAHASGAEE